VSGRRPWPVWIATCGGVGDFPVAPGTMASAVAVLLVEAGQRFPRSGPLLAAFPGTSAWPPRLWLMVGAALVFAAGAWTAGCGERYFGCLDPAPVVIDEVAGQLMAYVGQPEASWKWLVTGFLLFRALDVVKPFPARRAENLPGGWGIMLDDVVAGAYALVILSLLQFAFR
jgi:phosphatidylglycerophosphatase A